MTRAPPPPATQELPPHHRQSAAAVHQSTIKGRRYAIAPGHTHWPATTRVTSSASTATAEASPRDARPRPPPPPPPPPPTPPPPPRRCRALHHEPPVLPARRGDCQLCAQFIANAPDCHRLRGHGRSRRRGSLPSDLGQRPVHRSLRGQLVRAL